MIDRKPMRNSPRDFVGWEALRQWESIDGSVYSDSNKGKAACERLAGIILQWRHTVDSPEGHQLYEGLSNSPEDCNWQVAPKYHQSREIIPHAEFISSDQSCQYYIVQKDSAWSIRSQYDLEAIDPYELLAAGIASNLVDGKDKAILWDFYEADASTKELAILHGRYLWGRTLVRNCEPLPLKSRLRTIFRRLARKWL